MKALTVAGKRAVTKGDQKAITAGYLRVSTDSDEQANALVVQEDAVKRFGVDVLYQDVLSGAGVTRPGYEELKELVFTRQVGRIVINNVSRLGRDFAEAISFVAMCDEQCVELISLDQKDRPLTLKDSTQLLMTIFPMAIAATYKMDNQKKILAGYKNGRAMGKPMRKPCWGYQLSHDRLRFEPSPDFDEARRFIDHLKRNSWRMWPSLRSFDWADYEERPFNRVNGLRAWLINPTIRGGVAYGQVKNHKFSEILWERHPALLTHDEFREFEAIRKLNAKKWGANTTTQHRPLTSLCTCEECGKTMCYVSGRKHASVRCKTEGCSQHYKSTREDLILESLIPMVINGASEAMARVAAEEEVENPQVGVLETQIKGLMSHAGDPVFDEAIRLKQAELAALKAEAVTAPDEDVLLRLSDPKFWNNRLLPDQNALTVVLHEAVQGISISKQSVGQIHLKL